MIKHDTHLTSTNRELEHRVHLTHPGQADWATDETNKCATCIFWGLPDERYATALGSRPCAKHRSLMNGRKGKPVPAGAAACRFFTNSGAEHRDPPPDGLPGKSMIDEE